MKFYSKSSKKKIFVCCIFCLFFAKFHAEFFFIKHLAFIQMIFYWGKKVFGHLAPVPLDIWRRYYWAFGGGSGTKGLKFAMISSIFFGHSPGFSGFCVKVAA